MKNKWFAVVGIYLVALFTCIIALYLIPSLRGILDKTYVTEIGNLDITDKVSAYIVRDETVYVAGKDFKINRLAEADRLVKAGTRVVELTRTGSDEDDAGTDDSGTDLAEISNKYVAAMRSLDGDVIYTSGGKSKDSGYVSYYVDGAEAKFSTDNLVDLKRDDYETLKGYHAVETPKRSCSAGEPIFKIVRNSKWYLIFYLDNEAAEKYHVGNYVYLNVNDDQVRVQVSDVVSSEDTSRITLKCKSFFDGFLSERTLDTVITVASAQGLVLEDSSIVIDSDGQKGVFVKNKLGRHVYRPISVKADDGRKCVVYSDIYVDAEGNFVETLKTYDEIVSQPTEDDLKSVKAVMLEDKRKEEKEEENGEQ